VEEAMVDCQRSFVLLFKTQDESMFSAARFRFPLAAVRISSQPGRRHAAPISASYRAFHHRLFGARPRLAFVADIFQLIVGEVLDADQRIRAALHG
jgi:hypothetical protein